MGRIRQGARRLATLNGSPRGIAGGFALGLGLSLVPIPAAGMFVALALAPLLRCNLPATYLGSAVVNPVTGPFLYFAELWLGLWLTGRSTPRWVQLRGLDLEGWWTLLGDMVGPFLTGAAVMISAATAFSFAIVYPLARRWAAHRAARRDDEGDAHDSRERPLDSGSKR